MKILLTSDWHLKPRHPYTKMVEGKLWDELCQKKIGVLRLLPKIAEQKDVSIVVIAGDIFDTSNPPEALKAEFAKILNKFPDNIIVYVITGRAGEHDYINENNFVMMDLKEAFKHKSNINIYDKPFCEVDRGIGAFHLMLRGISPMYDKHAVELSDEIFRDYDTILLGDYHGFYKKTYGKKTFIYAGNPYPTRYGEVPNGVAIIDIDNKYKIKKISRVKISSFTLEEIFDINAIENFDPDNNGQDYVLKAILSNVKPKEINGTINKLNHLKHNLPNGCMDLIWEIKTGKIDDEKVIGKSGLRETCFEYIEKKSEYPKSCKKIFTRIESEC